MRESRNRTGLLVLSAVIVLLAATPGVALPEKPSAGGAVAPEALDYAFRFASTIRVDPKDMGRAQADVLMEYASAGYLKEAIERADLVEGWRRGVVYADLATFLARSGRGAQAASLLERARAFSGTVSGWQQKRIEAHIAQTLAALGRLAESRQVAGRLAADDPQQYSGQAVATVAAGQAAAGGYDEAMAELGALEKDPDIDAAWWRTAGYVALARRQELSVERRLDAARKARAASGSIPGWKRGEALRSIAEALDLLERRSEAKEALGEASEIFAVVPSGMPVKAPLLANLARSWATFGEPQRAQRLLDEALTLAGSTIEIDRPGIYANVAYGYQTAGDAARAHLVYDRALDAAESLVNARPRALAAVEICRSLGRARVDLDEGTRARLEGILKNLSDPW